LTVTLEEREKIVADGYAWLDETNARIAADEARYRAQSEAIQRAITLMVEQANAPLIALLKMAGR